MDICFTFYLWLVVVQKKTLKVPIYSQFKVTFAVTEDISSYYTKVTKENYSSNPIGIFFAKDGNLHICVQPNVSAGIIAHECFHATAYIMDVIGCELKERVKNLTLIY